MGANATAIVNIPAQEKYSKRRIRKCLEWMGRDPWEKVR